jgi:hypothetical protein
LNGVFAVKKSVSTKILSPRPWLTLHEAARKLYESGIGEGTEACVLRMALDSNLKLSVYFINKAYGFAGSIIHVSESDMIKGACTGVYPNDLKWSRSENCDVEFLESIFLEKDKYWILGGDFLNINKNKLVPIEGVWDLILIHDGRTSIENKWLSFIDATKKSELTLKGIYIKDLNGNICQLRKLFDYKVFQSEFELQMARVQEKVSSGSISTEEAEKLTIYYQKDRQKHLEKVCLPAYSEISEILQDSVLVVRSEALGEFIDQFNKCDVTTGTLVSDIDEQKLIDRDNDYNGCAAKAIVEFHKVMGYFPSTVDEVISRIKQNPPHGYIVNFRGEMVSVNGATERSIKNFKRTINRLLNTPNQSS